MPTTGRMLGFHEFNIQDKIDRERIRAYRQEASRLASMANKRLKRLEERGLTDSPAYQMYLREGGEYFSVRGKTQEQLRDEVRRMRKFVEAQTSTIRGLTTQLRDMAENTGIQYTTTKELLAKSKRFFELHDKVKEYLNQLDRAGEAMGYQKIWEAINEQVQIQNFDLSDSESKLDSMIKAVSEALMAEKEREARELQPKRMEWRRLT